MARQRDLPCIDGHVHFLDVRSNTNGRTVVEPLRRARARIRKVAATLAIHTWTCGCNLFTIPLQGVSILSRWRNRLVDRGRLYETFIVRSGVHAPGRAWRGPVRL